MIPLTCLLGRMGGVNAPAQPLMVGGRSLDQILADASGGDIKLTVDDSTLAQDLDPARRQATAFDLHSALRDLTQNPPTGPVSRIGVIYTGEYSNFPMVLGIMFDRGFTTDDDPNNGFKSVPREGCAIFVDSIERFRKFDADATRDEIAFTTVHELGHVFNLEHTQQPSFLSLSVESAVHRDGFLAFTPTHDGLLRQCSTCRCIQPGGTPYGDRDELHSSFEPNSNNAPAAKGGSSVQLEIQLTRPSFWYFEPVELELTVSVPRGVGHRRIPDAFDPGHEQFSLWIESPGGERRTYRSPKFFCAIPQTRSITPTTPFRRDLSIFGESGGYTFRQPGEYRLWVTFRAGRSTTIASNIVTCEIRPPAARYREFARMVQPCTAAGSLFYYRAARDLKRAEKIIEQLKAVAPRSANSAIGKYALGRAHAHQAIAHDRASASHARHATRLLTSAADSGKLGGHSEQRALMWIEKMRPLASR